MCNAFPIIQLTTYLEVQSLPYRNNVVSQYFPQPSIIITLEFIHEEG